jgi:DNA helicase HerA-like ATPase
VSNSQESPVSRDNPLQVLTEFIEHEKDCEDRKAYDQMRFVGYVLDIGFDDVTIITSDPLKISVGGVPRNSLLIMMPDDFVGAPQHFTLLRVIEPAPTPLSGEVQQTYFELQKRSMPELDRFTQSELQWGALKTRVLGMFYPHPENQGAIEFSGDLNNYVSAHKYRVYAPNERLLNLIVNSLIPDENRFELGTLRMTECRLSLPAVEQPNVQANVSTKDFMGTRTAMFGKTRYGKSNVIKLIAQSLIETTRKTKNVGQIIFDINGEYANPNPQDNNSSLAAGFSESCKVYAITPKEGVDSKPLKLNFYEHPDRSHAVLADLLESSKQRSNYAKNFIGAQVPALDELGELDYGEKTRAKRRILMYWAILKKAGYDADEEALVEKLGSLDPGFNKDLREAAYEESDVPSIDSLNELVTEFEQVLDLRRKRKPTDTIWQSSGSGRPLLESDDIALLDFLKPAGGSGPKIIQPFRIYHEKDAGNFIEDIIGFVDGGKTVVIDLGNAVKLLMEYYSNELTEAIFQHQVTKFTGNALGNHYVQFYFEEAHNLFPSTDDRTDIYARLAKEGGKYHIGMVYSTQSVTSIHHDLLAQTDNFFIAHLSSQYEVSALVRMNVAYESMRYDILQSKTPGYVRMLTRSHRFVIPVQARAFTPPAPKAGAGG